MIKEKLEALMEACVTGNCDKGDAITAELIRMSLNEEIDRVLTEIHTLAESLDYEEVIKKIESIQPSLP